MPSSSRKERLKRRDEREYQERESRSGFSIFHVCSPSIIRRHYHHQWALRPPISRPRLRHPTILEVSTICFRLPVRIYDLWFMELRASLPKGLKVGKSIDVGHPQAIAMLMWVRQY